MERQDNYSPTLPSLTALRLLPADKYSPRPSLSLFPFNAHYEGSSKGEGKLRQHTREGIVHWERASSRIANIWAGSKTARVKILHILSSTEVFPLNLNIDSK